MNKRIVIFAFPLLLISEVAMAVEEPKYTTILQEQEFELREYAPKIIAQTTVTGDYDSASSRGFRILADYIFGNNQIADAVASNAPENLPVGKIQSSKISMTAPVAVTPASNNEESNSIAMTAPVSMSQTDGSWQVSFVMPSQYTMQSIPKPNNPAVQLIELPSQHYAVIRFSGLAGESKVAQKTQALMQWMNGKGLDPIGQPQVARYNPPWTLPFLRRNEVMIEYQAE